MNWVESASVVGGEIITYRAGFWRQPGERMILRMKPVYSVIIRVEIEQQTARLEVTTCRTM